MRAALLCLLALACEATSPAPEPPAASSPDAAPGAVSGADAAPEPPALPAPDGPGLHVRVGQAWQTPPTSLLAQRTAEAPSGVRTRAWCLDTERSTAVTLGAGTAVLVDDAAARWRPFRLDAEGCAWREQRDARERWEVIWREQPATEDDQLPDGRRRVQADLSEGDWFLADWDQGFFTAAAPGVLEDPAPQGARFTGVWLQVGGT